MDSKIPLKMYCGLRNTPNSMANVWLMYHIFIVISVMAIIARQMPAVVAGGSAGSSAANLANNVETEDPEFTDVIDNITVPAGRNIKLACSVKNLGSYKVRFHSILSSPPTTLPPPTTTTLATTTTTTMNEFDMLYNGIEPTNSVIVIDKLGIKYQSNLNEIDKSEQKLMGDTPKGYDWSKDKPSSATRLTTSLFLGWPAAAGFVQHHHHHRRWHPSACHHGHHLHHPRHHHQLHVSCGYLALILMLRSLWSLMET
ncbi:uncharacterized protein LOC131807122 [Musca domestica]|uniref:Uncharacterized protein LOC131807122 n=1 Tax=Musca domestica TaxID=7370 RepID=A0ABM3VQN9_MUSDO|nr:uncharacterized protein LOC131807122 [Musca domestica]